MRPPSAHPSGTIIVLLLSLSLSLSCSVFAATQYLYDDLGRLVLVANTDGSSIVYDHDANGNVVGIYNSAASTVVVAGFSPAYGHAGQTIEILGSGFDPDPQDNTVVIGGVAASVVASNPTTLSAVIPSGAVTGPVTVTVSTVAATSLQSFVVQRPTITSFSPGLVAPGQSVTVTGQHFELESGATISVGGVSAVTTYLSNDQAVFTAPNNSGGPIVLSTSYGEATSASSLVTVPSAITLGNVVGTAVAEADGPAEELSFSNPNEVVLYSFDAEAGDFLTFQLDALTITPSNGWLNFMLYGPSGASVTWGAIWTTTAQTLHLPMLAASGQYLLAINSGSGAAVEIDLRLERDPILDVSGVAESANTTTLRQTKRFVFEANAGEDFGIGITSLAISPSPPNNIRLWVYDKNGAYVQTSSDCYLTSTPGCGFRFVDMPLTGAYTAVVNPVGTATMSFDISVTEAFSETLAEEEPLNVDLVSPGAFALVSFEGTSGFPLALHITSTGTTPAGESIQAIVYDSLGTQVKQVSFTSDQDIYFQTMSSGTHTLLLAPGDASTLFATVTLNHEFSAWNDSIVPPVPAYDDSSAVELGTKFKADFDGYVTGIRFYKGSGNTGTHIGNLWTTAGQNLASVTFTDETSTGWQQATFSTPIPVTAGTVYVASYHAPAGHFAYAQNQFWSTGVDAGPLHLLAHNVSGPNGVYAYSSTSTFPSSVYGGSNYWVDVVYQFVDETPPTVVSTTPRSSSAAAGTNAEVIATFSEAVNPDTVNGSTVELKVTGGATVSASVSYDATSHSALLMPDAALAAVTSYTVTVKGGASGVEDMAGNLMSADYTWSFTTSSGPVYSAWDDLIVPAVPASTNSNNSELGVKFKLDADGYVLGVRFFKGAGNGGTHTGSLWTSSGTLLATATFVDETVTGWQEVEFSTPVAVTANTVYVVSYHAPQGLFAWGNGFFASSGVDNGPLHLLQNGVSGANGVYAYGSTTLFPDNTYNSSNYWADVLFVPSP